MGNDKIPAHTFYTVLQRFHGCCLVECTIETGRHHQIRKHFAMIKHPLVMDDVYGDRKTNASFKRSYHYSRFFLHASAVAFEHPFTHEQVRIEAERPRVFEAALKKMRSM